jgi:O-6-methylguanine DNA methyltransferase
MQCRSVLTRIDAQRTGELPEEDCRAVDEHLSYCRSCSASIHDLSDFARTVKSLKTETVRSIAPQVCAAVSDSFDTVRVGDVTVLVAFSDAGVTRIDLSEEGEDAFRKGYRERFGRTLRPGTLPEIARRSVEAALHGKSIDLPALDLSSLGEFERKVLEAIRRIPRGEVRTYEWVARAAGRPKAIRAVGNVMASNPLPLLLPCHRVVPTAGGLGNYGYGPEMKRRLLSAENVPVEELELLAKRGIRFIGSRTTKIFCFPSCRDAKRIREENRVPFHNAHEAEDSGFRPCLHCTPVAA